MNAGAEMAINAERRYPNAPPNTKTIEGDTK